MKNLLFRNLVLSLIIVFASSFCAFSENYELGYATGHGLGVAAGGTSAVGIAYRTFFSNGVGIQSTFGAFGTSRYFDMFGGFQLMYKFHRSSPRLSYYALIGTGAILESFRHLVLVPGIGVGLEFNIVKGLTAALEIALAPYLPIAAPPTILGYLPLPFPGFALIYYF